MPSDELHHFDCPYPPDAGPIDLKRLQRAFSELMDRAAVATLRTGYDLDDVEVERLAVMRYAGHEQTATVKVESLTDEDRLLAPFRNHTTNLPPEQQSDRKVEIVGLLVRVVIDTQRRWPPAP
ncbi:MAG: hypothetical protein IID40_00525 [Planctomycetes bacterium]|nr:hypothetical protein [Planctomycetota bacterium]